MTKREEQRQMAMTKALLEERYRSLLRGGLTKLVHQKIPMVIWTRFEKQARRIYGSKKGYQKKALMEAMYFFIDLYEADEERESQEIEAPPQERGSKTRFNHTRSEHEKEGQERI